MRLRAQATHAHDEQVSRAEHPSSHRRLTVLRDIREEWQEEKEKQREGGSTKGDPLGRGALSPGLVGHTTRTCILYKRDTQNADVADGQQREGSARFELRVNIV